MYRKDIIQQIRLICEERYGKIDVWVHGLGHVKRVVKYCLLVAKKEKIRAKDVFLVEIAAWLHDIGRVGEEKNIYFNQSNHAEKSYRQARNILKKYQRFIGREDVIKILQAVREHSRAILDHKDNVVAKCLQDGDRGSSLNSIGIFSMLDYRQVIEIENEIKTIVEARAKLDWLFNEIKKRNKEKEAIKYLEDLRGFYYGIRGSEGNWQVSQLHFDTSRKLFRGGVLEIEEFINKLS